MKLDEAYAALGLEQEACDTRAAKRAFHKLSLEHHPDKNRDDPDATARFQEIGEACVTAPLLLLLLLQLLLLL